ncbi:hypothetical protein D7V21_09585 [Acinetobacter guerrae]|uniref:Uncharacterized protein n=1 Tax=Acinetobacter guerrae TaxID=1843371 RepID=A0A3A8ETR5_9GAMM|nr:hypothetical protein [Acinetobacter guerrae]RKG33414.1 hypothetical protein D7V21_09585 [Acinetobacter guerrae]
MFKVGDLVVKTHPKNTILWPVLGVYKNGGVWLDYKGFCWRPPRVRHATPEEIAAGHRIESSNDQTINHSFLSNSPNNENKGDLSIKQDSQVEVLDMVDVSPNCEVINETH